MVPLRGDTRFSIDGVDLSTASLPSGWRQRLVRVQNANTAAPGSLEPFTGWCLDKEDLCVAKLCAFREKDRAFVAALVSAGLVDGEVVLYRLGLVDVGSSVTDQPRDWFRSLLDHPA